MTWDNLNDQEKKYLKSAAKETMAYHRKLYDEQTKMVIDKAKNDLKVKFVEVEKAPFIAAVEPMHAELAKKSAKLASLVERIKSVE